jgi:EmrB/QacA subfamily drug resistance transporter
MSDDDHDQLRYAWRVLGLNVVVVSQPALTATMLNLAVPQISVEFSIGASELAVLVSGYWLVSTVLLLALGGLADQIGRRWLYILGILVFTAAGAGCASAPSGEFLIAMRLLQAVGAAAIVANGTALLTDAFPARLLSTAMGISGSVFSAFGLAGPVVGGFVASFGGARAIFWFSVPFGAIGLALSLFLLQKPEISRTPGVHFDSAGAVLSAAGLTGLMIYLSQAPSWGWASQRAILVAALTVAVLVTFSRLELRRSHPLVDLRLFGAWHRSAAYLAHGLIAISDLSIALAMSLYFQQVLGLTPVEAGLRLLPITLGAIVAAPIAGRLAAWLPSRLLSSCGAGLHAGALIVLVIEFSYQANLVVTLCCLAAIGIGSSFFGTPNTHFIMASVPAERRGVANALRSTIQNASGLAGTALILAVIGGSTAKVTTSPGPFRTAMLVLTAMCLLATVVSLARGRSGLAPSSQ